MLHLLYVTQQNFFKKIPVKGVCRFCAIKHLRKTYYRQDQEFNTFDYDFNTAANWICLILSHGNQWRYRNLVNTFYVGQYSPSLKKYYRLIYFNLWPQMKAFIAFIGRAFKVKQLLAYPQKIKVISQTKVDYSKFVAFLFLYNF